MTRKRRKPVIITLEQCTEILHAVAKGEQILDILARLGIPTSALYNLRRDNSAFERSFLAAAEAAGNSLIKPIRTAPTRARDFDRDAVIQALRNGASMAEAAEQVGTHEHALWRTRWDEPEFDRAAKRAIRKYGRGPGFAPREIDRQALLAALRDGATLPEAARAAGVSAGTLYNRRLEDPDLERQIRQSYQAYLPGIGTRTVPPVPPPWRCEVPGCEATEHHGRGLCIRHYYQKYRTGRSRPAEWKYGREGCTVPDCPEPHRAKGLCIKHYDAQRKAARRKA